MRNRRLPWLGVLVLCVPSALALPQGEVLRPRLVLSPAAIPAGAAVPVRVTATHADGSAIDPLLFDFLWSAPGAQFTAGTSPSDPAPLVLPDGSAPQTVELVLTPKGLAPAPAHSGKGSEQIGLELGAARLHGSPVQWQPVELWFDGPQSAMDATDPNPFLDLRLQVELTRPDGSTWELPGFYDGDGRGGGSGAVYKLRFTPDAPGTWSFVASLRSAPALAVSPEPEAGTPVLGDGASGSFAVEPRRYDAPGFWRRGRLSTTGEHYAKFADGPYWIKSGVDSPENLLAFAGFAEPYKAAGSKGLLHRYEPHAADWTLADPELVLAGQHGADAAVSRNLFGALRYLGEVGVNSVYFLPMNLGGDGQDTFPFLSPEPTAFARTHYHLPRLHQWAQVFDYAQQQGVQLQIVLSETETANVTWLDGGALGVERRLFFRELCARFAHHNALKWNLAEESNFAAQELLAMAAALRSFDGYAHPIAVHNTPAALFALHDALLGEPLIGATSIQYPLPLAGALVEQWRAASAAAGQAWILDLDENNPAETGAQPDNAEELRREVLYDVYFSGGQLEWYLGAQPLPVGGDHSVEDFRTREELWHYTRHARELLETVPCRRMAPADGLLFGELPDHGGGEVLAAPGEAYLVFLPNADAPEQQLDLSGHSGPFEFRWFDPRMGQFVGATETLAGGAWRALGSPPAEVDRDWVAVVRRPTLWAAAESLSLSDGGTTPVELHGSPLLGGLPYVLLGSLSGTAPGFELEGLHVPLAADSYFAVLLGDPWASPVQPFSGLFDVDGRASAVLTLPPLDLPSLAGKSLTYLWLAGTLDPQHFPVAVSEPLSVLLSP
jgi:hypothetical protein